MVTWLVSAESRFHSKSSDHIPSSFYQPHHSHPQLLHRDNSCYRNSKLSLLFTSLMTSRSHFIIMIIMNHHHLDGNYISVCIILCRSSRTSTSLPHLILLVTIIGAIHNIFHSAGLVEAKGEGWKLSFIKYLLHFRAELRALPYLLWFISQHSPGRWLSPFGRWENWAQTTPIAR